MDLLCLSVVKSAEDSWRWSFSDARRSPHIKSSDVVRVLGVLLPTCRWTSTSPHSVLRASSSCDNCAVSDGRSVTTPSPHWFTRSSSTASTDCVRLLVGSLAAEDDSQAATCSQRSCASRVKLRQVRPTTDPFPAPCSTLARRR